ncbi:MAG: hypothetical protein M3N47_10040, partial [Chloroflexota bacterium]|nr:hypothetical protein [Chloroflexota bacterium]
KPLHDGRESMSNRTVFTAALALGVLIGAPFAVADTGDPVNLGVRNPSGGDDANSETQIIARTGKDTYGTRQSNLGAGGGAIYGCRSVLDTSSIAAIADPKKSTPCVRVNNLSSGKAFDFRSKNGRVIGVIQAGHSLLNPQPTTAPFVTNANGVAAGLNADRVDNLNASEIIAQAVQAAKTAGGGGAAASPGCPANTVLVGGGCIETAPRGTANYADAAAACGGAGRRLVPPDVLLHARTLEGIDLGGGEMSADLTPASVVALTGVIVEGYATVNDAGAVRTAPQAAPSPFRCITG